MRGMLGIICVVPRDENESPMINQKSSVEVEIGDKDRFSGSPIGLIIYPIICLTWLSILDSFDYLLEDDCQDSTCPISMSPVPSLFIDFILVFIMFKGWG